MIFKILPLFILSALCFSNHLRLLEDNVESAQIRLDLAQQAESEISAAYFIFKDDEVGLDGLWAMRQAARRGVRVRLIIDAQWNKVSLALIKHLKEEGVELRCYHPFRFSRPFWVTRRMHDKLFIVDGVNLITGGRNIENAYFGLGHRNYVDRDVYVWGPTAAHARDYFDELWESHHVSKPDLSKLSPRSVSRAARKLDARGLALLQSKRLSLNTCTYWPELSREAPGVRFLYDPVTDVRKRPGIRADLLDLVVEAKSSIYVETPYLVVTKKLMKLLAKAADRGLHVRILTNSLHSTDNLFPQAGYIGRKKKMARLGVELWEYRGPESLHAKTAVIDERLVIIGSYNVDPRSERLNTEVALVADDPELANQVLQSMDAHLSDAWLMDGHGKPLGSDYPKPGCYRRFKLQMIRFILPLIWDQL